MFMDIIYYGSQLIQTGAHMLTRLTTRLLRTFTSPLPLPKGPHDMSNMSGYISASSEPKLTILQKLSNFTPGNMYTAVDQFSRELLFTFANDWRMGLPVAVVAIAFLLRGSFFYYNVRAQIGAMKMKDIKPDMERVQMKMRQAQATRNMALMKSARQQLKQVYKKKGIDNFYAFVNIIQIPFLITWFLSLRHVAALPQVFPSVTQSFLWVPDLSAYDPYFLFPIISALLTSYSIVVSPALKSNVVNPMFEPFVKYLKFLPILSLFFTGYFPAILNIYWCGLALNQALLMMFLNTSWMRKHYVEQKELPKSQIQQAVFVEEKKAPKVISQDGKIKVQSSTSQSQTQTQGQSEIQTGQKLQILSKKPKKAKKLEQ